MYGNGFSNFQLCVFKNIWINVEEAAESLSSIPQSTLTFTLMSSSSWNAIHTIIVILIFIIIIVIIMACRQIPTMTKTHCHHHHHQLPLLGWPSADSIQTFSCRLSPLSSLHYHHYHHNHGIKKGGQQILFDHFPQMWQFFSKCVIFTITRSPNFHHIEPIFTMISPRTPS